MQSNRSLVKTFFFSSISLLIFFILFFAIIWIKNEINVFQDSSEQVSIQYIDQQKLLIKQEVERVADIIILQKTVTDYRLRQQIRQRTYEAHQLCTNLYINNKNTIPPNEMKKLLHDALFAISWDNGKGYYFAETMDGIEMVNRNNPELEGQDIIDLQDSKGTYLVREIIKTARSPQGEGFCSYYWNKPSQPGELVPKISFVKYFEPMDWVIGNGKYLADEESKVQREVLKWVESIRFGNDNYIFAGTFQGKTLCGPSKGKNNIHLKDLNGVEIVKELIKKASSGGGFTKYVMPDIDGKKVSTKLSYTKEIPGWNWYIGTGVYIDELEKVIQDKQKVLNNRLKTFIIKISLLLLSMLLTVYLTTLHLSNRLKRNLDLFSGFFSRASREAVEIETDKLSFNEFRQMAAAANQMIREKELSEKEKSLLQEKLQEAQKMEAIGIMAGGVAHDLNNILSGISTYPELLLRKLPPESDLKRIVKTIQKSGERASLVVDDLLTVARGVACKKTAADLNLLIREYLSSPEFTYLKEKFPETEIIIKLSTYPLIISCSSIHIKKTVMNLVTNAFESIELKGRIIISTEIIDIQKDNSLSLPPADYAAVKITDNGPGIPEDKLERIFEPFFTKKEMGKSGTGLGLTIVWNTMLDHLGAVDVSSSNKETEFTLYFPLSDDSVRSDNTEIDLKEFYGHGEKILIIDDEESQREITADFLDHLNYQFELASSGEEALQKIKATPYDLLILDMIMKGGMNGKETYEQILKISPSQKVVVVSGFSADNDVKEILQYGFGEYLKKPYNLKSLAKTLRDILKR